MENSELHIQMDAYLAKLSLEERSTGTIQQYRRDITQFLTHLAGRPLTKAEVIGFKEALEQRYRATSVNAKLAAVNGFLNHLGRGDLRVKALRIQRKAYCPQGKELSKSEYLRLVQAAQHQENERLSLLLQTLCGTGIRVSELQFITAEAVQRGEAVVQLKGKTQMILIPDRLRRKLRQFARQERITAGPIFATRSGAPLDRSNIWKMMKALCRSAGVDESKVFPHNLRHLFARAFYSTDRDIAKLADILGHSSINTTRIYIISTGWEHRQKMDTLGLVI